MSNQNISDVRAHLFAVLAGLRDKDNPMDIERAKAISDAAQVIINSAKVEVDYMKVAGYPASGSGFLDSSPPELPPGITGVKVHRLKG